MESLYRVIVKIQSWLCHSVAVREYVAVFTTSVFTTYDLRLMLHSITSVGIHVILMPCSDVFALPLDSQVQLTRIAEETAVMSGCTFKTLHVSVDHMHVLFVSKDEQSVNTFLPAFAERARQYLCDADTKLQTFEWNERLHVTLLPPWHVEILASFVRDQDNFHLTRSLQEELEEVFLPNATAFADSEDDAVVRGARFN